MSAGLASRQTGTWKKTETDDVAIFARAIFEVAHRVAEQLEQVAGDECAARAGRAFAGCGDGGGGFAHTGPLELTVQEKAEGGQCREKNRRR